MTISNLRFIRITLFLIILVWNIGIFWEFVVVHFNFGFSLLPILKYNYSIVCHTESDKLLQYGLYSTLTCSRCTGIYFGSLITAFLLIFTARLNISTRTFLLISIPLFADVALNSFGFYHYNKIIAVATGLLLGSMGFVYIQKSLLKFLTNKIGR